jgi:AGZA family xanthine/uracil permease-like MFS transporter
MVQGVRGKISAYFKIEERGSTIGTEIRAGIVTFLTMSYILLVNPQIISLVSAAEEYAYLAGMQGTSVTCPIISILGMIPC